MENASKALLIAGAILIAIVLITLGVGILGEGQETINNSSMSETEIATFNAKFTGYAGSNVRGSKVNSMLNAVLQHNLANQGTENAARRIDITGTPSLGKDAKKIESKADTGKTYSVTLTYSENSGLITTINVDENGKTGE